MRKFLGVLFLLLIIPFTVNANTQEGIVAVIDMKMMILPGTENYLKSSITRAHEEGAKALIVKLDTPGGILTTSQEMIQAIFRSPIPVIIYVTPTGATATSAGVFITMAGHVAAMTPGTSIGAAHPVMGEGKDIAGDMRQKAENMTVTMVQSISEERGRNIKWVEKAVRESSTLIDGEALKQGVIDVIANDINSLLVQLKGKKIKVNGEDFIFDDYSKLPIVEYEISFQDKSLNVLANPNVAALLWMAATTGLSLELYNPGAILPGVVGVICLILALAVSQIIPLSQGAIALIIVGALLIGAEIYISSGILGAGGVIAMVIGALYLVDTAHAPGMEVSAQFVIPVALVFGGLLLFVVHGAVKTMKKQIRTGVDGLLGQVGRAMSTVTNSGKIFVNGEVWDAVAIHGIVDKDDHVRVVEVRKGMVLVVEKYNG